MEVSQKVDQIEQYSDNAMEVGESDKDARSTKAIQDQPDEQVEAIATDATTDHRMPTDAELGNLRGLLRYYTDGLQFINLIESAVPHLIALLASNAKGEVVEAMHFFVMAHRYEMECAQVSFDASDAIN